jgi:type II restriction enzyme
MPQKTAKIFRKIKDANTPAFAIDEAIELMSVLLLEKIKSSNSEKSDIVAIIKDNITEYAELGFSIKSQIGGASSLLNASQKTNFVFKINNFVGNVSRINDIEGKNKIQERLRQIYEQGGTLEFSHITSTTFTRNIRLIDTVLPELLANMLLSYFSARGRSLKELSQIIGHQKLFGLDEVDIAYKVKNFLRAIALGMVPGKKWDTYLSAYGGYIIVRDDGMLLCYHLYNDDDFKDYLFNHTKFDTPSSTRHNFGSIYYQDDKPMINLNLQIRFLQSEQ